MTTEEWRPVVGHLRYEVSNLGRVRSLRYVYLDRSPHVLSTYRAGRFRQYEYVSLGKGGKASVHTLVAKAFIGPRPEGHDVRHLDGDSTNNRADNLAYGTRSQNMRDTVLLGTNPEANKTHCKQGHEFTPENTAVRISSRGWPRRDCKTCTRASKRASSQRARDAAKQVAA